VRAQGANADSTSSAMLSSSAAEDVLSIQLVALDLDGTILEDGSLIRPETIDAIFSCRERGVRFATASGRPLDFQLATLERFALDHGAFSALICDERDLHVYRHGAGGEAAFAPVASWNEPTHARWDTLAKKAFDWVEWSLAQARKQHWPARLHYTWEDTADRGLGVVGFESETHAIQLAEVLRTRLKAECPELACNRNRRLVQVHDALVDKASSLAALAKTLDVEPRQVLAIGDSDNDRTMVDGSLGFRSATVANATSGIKAVVERVHGAVADARAGAGVAALLGELLRAQ
jgi:HAD superfamily hydrolase (TIGR01484 family)